MSRVSDPLGEDEPKEIRILSRNNDQIITQDYYPLRKQWDRYVAVYPAYNAPAAYVKPRLLNMPDVPTEWKPLEGVEPTLCGMELWRAMKRQMGEQGVMGMPSGMRTCLLNTADDVYDYYENPAVFHKKAEQMLEKALRRIKTISGFPAEDKPDFLTCGASGSLVLQSPSIFRELILPALTEVTKAAKAAGIATHVHSCGQEKELVRMAVEHTDLTIIDPLEVPPMGDCNLADLKKEFGHRIVLKGNLHTTDIMLNGSVQDVIDASKRGIDAAAVGGGFILSTGDQCGRDTPEENIIAMIQTARDYGKY